MLRDRLHIPSTFDTDTYVSDLIETSISDSLTQACSRIKKTVCNILIVRNDQSSCF